jgi:hypothetical protein
MGYAQAMNQYQANAYPGQALGGLAGANKASEPPRTIASAGNRLETLNERLAKATDALATVCSQIGAMTLSQGGDPKANAPAPIGAVHRLNELADDANSKLSAIEAYIGSIQRALG